MLAQPGAILQDSGPFVLYFLTSSLSVSMKEADIQTQRRYGTVGL